MDAVPQSTHDAATNSLKGNSFRCCAYPLAVRRSCARLKKGEEIDRLLYDGYSTISLGYAGLWECVYSLIGKKLTEPEGKELGLEIMRKLNEYCTL